MAELNEKQKRFCEEYLVHLSGAEAARRAGYSPNSAKVLACELLKKPEIREYIGERMEQKKNELIADQNEVLEYLTSVMRGKTKSEVVVNEFIGGGCSQGRIISKYPDEKEKLKASELLGKAYGLTNSLKVEADVGVTIVDDLGGLD